MSLLLITKVYTAFDSITKIRELHLKKITKNLYKSLKFKNFQYELPPRNVYELADIIQAEKPPTMAAAQRFSSVFKNMTSTLASVSQMAVPELPVQEAP